MTSADRVVSAGLFAAGLAAWLVFRQEAYWSDGRHLIGLLERGSWTYKHVAYLPLAHAVHMVSGRVLGLSPESSLFWLSALCGSVALGLTYLAARTCGAGVRAACAGSVLVGVSPTVVFFSTCVEVHAAQLLVAAAAVLWAAGSWRRSRWERSLPGAVLALGALAATHVTGLLWAPAAALLVLRTAATWSRARQALAGVGALLVAVGVWLWAGPRFDTFIAVTSGPVQSSWSFAFLWTQLLRPAGLLMLPIAALLLPSRHAVPGAGTPRLPWIAALLVFLPFVLYLPSLRIDELGAYAISLYPLLGVGTALGLERLRALALPTALVLASGQALLAADVWSVWNRRYPGADWVPELVEEVGERGALVTREKWEYGTTWSHSRLEVLLARNARFDLDLSRERDFELAAAVLRAVRQRGGRVAVTRSLVEDPDPRSRALLDRLRARFGEPAVGARPQYMVFP